MATVDISLRWLLLPQMRQMRAADYEVFAYSAPGDSARELERAGVTFRPVPGLERGWNPRGDLEAVRAIARYLREDRIDVLHTHMPKGGVLGRVAGALARTDVVVHTIHGLYYDQGSPVAQKALVWSMERVGGMLCDHVLAQNRDDYRRIVEQHVVPRSKVTLVGNGVDLFRFRTDAVSPADRLALRSRHGIARDAVVVGIVARHVWSKGFAAFFEAARRLASAGCVFLSVGPTEPGKKDGVPQDVIDALRHSGQVRFLGMCDRVEEAYSIMDLVTLPSRFPEGVPRGLIEPAAMGKPLVTTDNKGCRDVVQNGVNGFVVPIGDNSRFVAAVEQLAGDAGLRERMGRASRKRAESHFDEAMVTRRTLELYHTLRSRPSRPRQGGNRGSMSLLFGGLGAAGTGGDNPVDQAGWTDPAAGASLPDDLEGR